MKIVHISHLYHPSQGGVQIFFKNISERLVRDYGDDVTVVTTDSIYGPERKIYKLAGPKHETINGVKVIRFPFKRWHIKPYFLLSKVFKKLSINMPEKFSLLAYGPYSPAMKKYLLKSDADIFCGSSINYYHMQLPLWRKCNFFFQGSIHLDEDETKKTLLNTQVQAIKASTLYFANTAYEKERLKKLGIAEKKVFILGVGVNMNDFVCNRDEIENFRANLAIPIHAVVVGYVGRIERPKNIALLMKAFLNLAVNDGNLYLLIAGSANTHLDELKQFCSGYPADVLIRIKWVINFSFEEKRLVFNAIDILVLTSHYESFGIVFLEAWSCRKPVIGTNIGAIRNVVNDEEDGLLINVNDEAHLASQLTRLITDKTLRDNLGIAGYNKVKENYTWDIIVSRLRKCYVNALKKSNYN